MDKLEQSESVAEVAANSLFTAYMQVTPKKEYIWWNTDHSGNGCWAKERDESEPKER